MVKVRLLKIFVMFVMVKVVSKRLRYLMWKF